MSVFIFLYWFVVSVNPLENCLLNTSRSVAARYLAALFLWLMLCVVPDAEAAVPVADAGNDQTVKEAAVVTLDGSGSASSAAGETISYRWVVVPAVTITNADQVVASFVAPGVDVDTAYTATLTVTDSSASPNTDSDDVVVTVENVPVTADAGDDVSVEEGQSVTLSGAGTPAGASFSWTVRGGVPAGATLTGAATRTLVFTAPPVETETTYTLDFTVTSAGGESAKDSVDVTVTAVVPNTPPVAAFTATPSADGTPLSIDFDASASTAANGSIVSYFWRFGDGRSRETTGPTTTYVYRLKKPYNVSLKVTDNQGKEDTLVTEISVEALNQAPVAEDDTISVEGGAREAIIPVETLLKNDSDPEGDTLRISSVSDNVTLSGDSIRFSPGRRITVNDTFTYKVRDPEGLTSDNATVSFALGNILPIAEAGSDQVVSSQATVTLDGSASSDDDGTVERYLWEKIGGPAVTLENADRARARFTVPDFNGPSIVLEFKLTVTDNKGGFSSDVVRVTANNPPPLADAGGDAEGQIVITGEEVSSERVKTVVLDGSGSTNPEGGTLTYSWAQVPLEGESTINRRVTLTDSDQAKASFPVIAVNTDSLQLKFTLTVTNQKNVTATDDVLVIIGRVGDPVLALAGEDQAVLEGSTVTLFGRGFFRGKAQDGLAWKQLSGPDVALDARAKPGEVAFVTPVMAAGKSETLVFELTATTSLSLFDTDTVEIKVSDNRIGDLVPEAYLSFLSGAEDEQPAGIRVNGGNLVFLSPSVPDNKRHQPRRTPIGLIDITAKTASPGATPQFEIYLTEAAPDDYTWYRHDETYGWREFPRDSFRFNADRTVVTFSISDAGELDEGQKADSRVVTRVGLGQRSFSTQAKAVSGGGSASMILLLLLLVSGWARGWLNSSKSLSLVMVRRVSVIVLLGWATTSQAWQTEYFAGGSFGSLTLEKNASQIERELEGKVWPGATAEVADRASILKIYGGAFFTPAMGLRAAYINLGQADLNVSGNVPVNEDSEFANDALNALPNTGTGFALSLLGRFSLGEHFVVHDWIGAFFWQNDLSVVLNGKTFDASKSGTDFLFGLGLEYIFDNGMGLRLEAERYNQDSDAIDMLGLGASYYF